MRLAAVAVAALLLTGCAASDEPAFTVASPTQTGPFKGTTLDKAMPKPDVTLTDTSGKPFNVATDTKGKVVALYIGYTHCPDVCPTTMADLSVAMSSLPKDVAQDVDVVMITSDPDRDTPKRLGKWLGSFSYDAIGLGLTAAARGYVELVVGYGLLFGFGGGIAFTLLQQAVIQASIRPSGLVNGYVVGLYPLGAMIGAPVFGWAIAAHGLRVTLAGLGITLAIASLAAALLLRQSAVRMHDASPAAQDAPLGQRATFLILFGVFFLAAAAGLMVLSQAAGIVQAYGGATTLALGATTFITGLIAAARIGGGGLVDRFAPPQVGAGAHLLSLVGALALIAWPGPEVAVLGLALIGAGYGLVSGLTVGALPRYWHRNLFGRIASRMYIAWCFAAISLPVLAGWIFDRTQGYAAAVMVAACGNVVGVFLASRLPRGNVAAPDAAARGS